MVWGLSCKPCNVQKQDEDSSSISAPEGQQGSQHAGHTCFEDSVHQGLFTVRLAQVQELLQYCTVRNPHRSPRTPQGADRSHCYQPLCNNTL